jgi:hypothetical protein
MDLYFFVLEDSQRMEPRCQNMWEFDAELNCILLGVFADFWL